MRKDIGIIKELDPADIEAVEAYGPKRSLRNKIDRRFLEKETVTSPEEDAIHALTNPDGVLIPGDGYASHDFRDHPDLEKHIDTLRAAWSDPSHPSHKTLQVLESLLARRKAVTTRSIQRPREEDLDYEVAWRRVNGQDVLVMGFTHKLDCYEANRGFYREILGNSAMLVTEGLQTVRLGYSMQASWAQPKETVFGYIMRDANEVNPNMLFGDNDPRDETEVILDEVESARPHLSQRYLEAFYAHLSEVSPSIARKLKSVDGLRTVLRGYAHDALMQRAKRNFLSNGALYCPFPHLDLDAQGRAILSEERTGLELGGLTNRDAVSAWTLRMVMNTLGSKNTLDGPIIDIQGAQHIDNKVYFFDHPNEAYVNIRRQPQFAFLPERGRFSAERFIPPQSRQNQEMIEWMVDSGVFGLNPHKDEAPQGFYETNGFAFARATDGKFQFCQP